MESQNKIFLCIPETQNNRGSLTTTKTNFSEKKKFFFHLGKKKKKDKVLTFMSGKDFVNVDS